MATSPFPPVSTTEEATPEKSIVVGLPKASGVVPSFPGPASCRTVPGASIVPVSSRSLYTSASRSRPMAMYIEAKSLDEIEIRRHDLKRNRLVKEKIGKTHRCCRFATNSVGSPLESPRFDASTGLAVGESGDGRGSSRRGLRRFFAQGPRGRRVEGARRYLVGDRVAARGPATVAGPGRGRAGGGARRPPRVRPLRPEVRRARDSVPAGLPVARAAGRGEDNDGPRPGGRAEAVGLGARPRQ
jgi:hypothetical protein